jgi:hypothetical protein
MEDYPPFLLSIAVHILLRNAAQALCIPSEVEQFETQDFKLRGSELTGLCKRPNSDKLKGHNLPNLSSCNGVAF